MRTRVATSQDAEAIARLHTDSWRRTYRGVYSDDFLDGDLLGNRLDVWTRRLEAPKSDCIVYAAEIDGRLAGFICGFADADPQHGSLVDNLHVHADFRRRGIARDLMARAGEWFAEQARERGVYLWVLEANEGARRFYETLAATNAETVTRRLESGNDGRVCRYVWPGGLSPGRPG